MKYMPVVHAVLLCSGIVLVSYGSWLVYRPAGLIVLGACCATLGVVGALRSQGPGQDGES